MNDGVWGDEEHYFLFIRSFKIFLGIRRAVALGSYVTFLPNLSKFSDGRVH